MGNQMNAAEQEYVSKLLSEAFTLERQREQAGLCRRCGCPDIAHSRMEMEMGEGNGRMTIIGCPPTANDLPPGIDWGRRRYLLQDGTVHHPHDSHSSLDDVGAFCIRWRFVEGEHSVEGKLHHEGGEQVRTFTVRGEAQDLCDWLNRRGGGRIYYWPSNHQRIEIP